MKELSMTHICMIILSIIVIIMFFQIQKLSKNNNYEDITNTAITDAQLTSINNQISQIYNMDVEAIRNLGAISKSLLTGTNYHSTTVGTPGTLTIPADTTQFKGTVNIDNNLTVNNNLTVDGEVKILDNLTVDGEVKVLDNLTVDGKVKVLDNLTVDGNVTTKLVDSTEIKYTKLTSNNAVTSLGGGWFNIGFTHQCPPGQVMVGISGRDDAMGMFGNTMRILCA